MKAFELKDGQIIPASDERASIHVYPTPDEKERQLLVEELHLDPYDLESALDPDEVSRVEFTSERVSLIWKRPSSASVDQQVRLNVTSVGLFLLHDKLIIVMNEDAIPFTSKEFHGAKSLADVLLRFLLHTVRHYLGHLKVIKQLTVDLESKISASMENRYLLQMFALSESLIYYLNSIESNGMVLSKLQGTTERLDLSKQLTDLLDDISLDNKQCVRQAQIYNTVLSGLMDARGTIVNNNMNLLLKNLTIINVIFLPLNLIASIGGMSEFSMMTQGVDWRVAYLLFSLGMVALGWITWMALNEYIEKGSKRRRKLFK